MSSVLVHGRKNDGRPPFSQDDTLTPSAFTAVKAEAEVGLKLIGQNSDMSVRSPMIYGSGGKGNFALLVKAVKMGLPLPFASVRTYSRFLNPY
jgi:UDP-glucose 4-epimerase